MAQTSNALSLLPRIKAQLQRTHGARLQSVVLYGSEARRTASPDSDIDILVVLRGEVTIGDELASLDALYPLILETERPIHASCVSAHEYEAGNYPLYRNAKSDGILA